MYASVQKDREAERSQRVCITNVLDSRKAVFIAGIRLQSSIQRRPDQAGAMSGCFTREPRWYLIVCYKHMNADASKVKSEYLTEVQRQIRRP